RVWPFQAEVTRNSTTPFAGSSVTARITSFSAGTSMPLMVPSAGLVFTAAFDMIVLRLFVSSPSREGGGHGLDLRARRGTQLADRREEARVAHAGPEKGETRCLT